MSYRANDNFWATLPNMPGLQYAANGCLLTDNIMAENYTKAQRDRRDFDRNMKILERENRIALNNIANEKAATAASMLVSERSA